MKRKSGIISWSLLFSLAGALLLAPSVSAQGVFPAPFGSIGVAGLLRLDPAVTGNVALNCDAITVSAMAGQSPVASTRARAAGDSRTCAWTLNLPAGRQLTIVTAGAAITVSGVPNVTSVAASTQPVPFFQQMQFGMQSTTMSLTVLASRPVPTPPPPSPTPKPPTLTIVSGDNQSKGYTGPFGLAVNFTTPVVVKLMNGNGQPIAGAAVVFGCPTGLTQSLACGLNGQSYTPTLSVTTNSSGEATLGSSGITVGINFTPSSATSAQVAQLANSSGGYTFPFTASYQTLSTTFHLVMLGTPLATPTPVPSVTPKSAATPLLPAGSKLAVVSGDNQSKGYTGPYGLAVNFTTPVVVKLTNASGQPVAGAPIVFACPTGLTQSLACGMNGQSYTPTLSVVTDSSGQATLGSSGITVGINFNPPAATTAQVSQLANSSGGYTFPFTASYQTLSTTFHLVMLGTPL